MDSNSRASPANPQRDWQARIRERGKNVRIKMKSKKPLEGNRKFNVEVATEKPSAAGI